MNLNICQKYDTNIIIYLYFQKIAVNSNAESEETYIIKDYRFHQTAIYGLTYRFLIEFITTVIFLL